jgi:hypothetical protein
MVRRGVDGSSPSEKFGFTKPLRAQFLVPGFVAGDLA